MNHVSFLRRLALCSAIVFSASAAQAAYTVVPLTVPGSTFTQLFGVNDAGQVVGGSSLGGFVYSGGTFTFLPSINGVLPTAFGISNAGLVVGSYSTSLGSTESNGFLYDGTAYSTFNVPGFSSTQIRGISLDGRYLTGYDNITNTRGFVYDRATLSLTVLQHPSTGAAIIQGANSAGLVTGGFSGPSGGAVIYNVVDGSTTVYNTVGGTTSPRFRGINDDGLISGWGTVGTLGGGSTTVGLVGSFAGGWQTITSPNGTDRTDLQGLNNLGVVVGNYFDANSIFTGFIATPVPEPQTYALLVAGLASVLLAVRRKRATPAV
jgi:hypothetical protein